jgi:DNA-binding transcriptional LysR family regulator
MYDPVETAELLAFARTVEAKSLSRAALELGVPRATLSRRLARLEERLAARLLRRTTRRLTLTDAGEAFYRHARIVLDAVAHAEASVRRSDDQICGDLRVSVPPLTSPSFRALLTDFAKRHPAVRLQVHVSTQLVDLQAGHSDVALRASSELPPGLIARTLTRDPIIAVAAPAYLAKSGVPKSRHDLRGHRCLLGFARGEAPQTHWTFADGAKLRVEGAFFCNDPVVLCDAAVSGLGIAILPMLVAWPFLQSGELVHILRDEIRAEARIAVVYPEREFIPPAVRAFVDAVVAWAPAEFARRAAVLAEDHDQWPSKRAGKPTQRKRAARKQVRERRR